MYLKKITVLLCCSLLVLSGFAQDSLSRRERKDLRKDEKRDRINALIKQEEEGALIYSKQFIFGVMLRNDGYGLMMEWGKMKTRRKSNLYQFELTEYKHPKEDKSPNNRAFFGNPYIYGKINNFYQAKLGFGQQYVLGDKGNKNGVSVSFIYAAGLSAGLLKPYYLEVEDSTGSRRDIKYDSPDSTLFLDPVSIVGGSGFTKGWGELKVKPGAYGRVAFRFDYGRFNELISALEAGLTVEAYSSKIPVMANVKDRQLFFQAYVMLEFGRRK